MSVRVRFAPSPTGFLHIGSLRTALYNYLFAKRHGGVCVLRVEDTDRTRFVEGAIEDQISCLAWAGVVFDEGPHVGGQYGPYTQSERFDLYREHANILLANGSAYYAFDTSEELDAMRIRQQGAGIAPKYDRSSMRNQYTLGENETAKLLAENAPHVVRLKVPLTTEVRFHDEIRGDMVIHGREIDDQILLKSDGFPTYHLANVVDDHLMEITHVIRAEEWLPSTPKHVLLYEAFGWRAPVFAHVPLLLNADRSKMSKRHGDVMVADFITKGYFPDALVNFVALCGWNPGTDREVFSLQELEQEFGLDRVSKAGAVFDYKKLDWMNGEYLKAANPTDLAKELAPELAAKSYIYTDPTFVTEVISLLRERVVHLKDIAEFGDYLFGDTLSEITPEVETSIRTNEQLIHALQLYSQRFSNSTLENAESFKALAAEVTTEVGIKQGAFMKPLRLVLTHKDVGADIYQTACLLGYSRCASRYSTVCSTIALVCFVGCTSTRPSIVAPCITAKTQDLIVSWGTEHDSANVRVGYSINTKGEVFSVTGPLGTTTNDTLYLGFVDPKLYCEKATEVRDAFLKTQALNVRGKRGRYIVYTNAMNSVYLRAVWNPDLETFQSREMRLQYDALMQLLPQQSEK